MINTFQVLTEVESALAPLTSEVKSINIGINPKSILTENDLPAIRLEPVANRKLDSNNFPYKEEFNFLIVIGFSIAKFAQKELRDIYKTSYDLESQIRQTLHNKQVLKGLIEFESVAKVDSEYMPNRLLLFTNYSFKSRDGVC